MANQSAINNYMHLPKMKDSRMAQPIANFCNDQTIEHLTHHYGANLEALGTQRFLLISMLATDGMEDGCYSAANAVGEIANMLQYLDSPARAGLIAGICEGIRIDDVLLRAVG
jgi:hypothetical protein